MSESRKIAKEYIEKQLKTMQKYGGAPKLGKVQFKKLIDDTEKIFVALKPAKERAA